MGTPLPRGVSAGRWGPPPAHAPPGGSAPAEGALPTPPTKGTLKLQLVQRPDTCRPPSPTRTAGPGLGAPSPFYLRPRAARGRRVRPADGQNEAGRAPENGRCRRGAVLTPPLPPAPEPNGRPAGSQVRLGGLGGACDGAGPAGGSGDAEGGSWSLTRHSPTPRTQNPEHRWPGPNTRWPRGAARPAPGRPDRCRPGSDAVPTRSAEGAVSAPPTGAKANGP